MSKTSFNLSTKPDADLKPHANHKIEISGTVAASRASATASAPAAGAGASASASTTPQEFSVDSFKMVAAACP